MPIAQSTWELICENQDSGSGFEVTEAILEHFKLLSLSAKQVGHTVYPRSLALPQWARPPAKFQRSSHFGFRFAAHRG